MFLPPQTFLHINAIEPEYAASVRVAILSLYNQQIAYCAAPVLLSNYQNPISS